MFQNEKACSIVVLEPLAQLVLLFISGCSFLYIHTYALAYVQFVSLTLKLHAEGLHGYNSFFYSSIVRLDNRQCID